MTGSKLLGVFETPRQAAAAVEALGGEGDLDLQVFAPVPDARLLGLAPRRAKPVRYIALLGALAGLASGFALALGSALLYRLIVNGMHAQSFVPHVVPGFEGTILLGGLGTMLGLLLGCRLPELRRRSLWDERLSETHFGVELSCDADEADRLAALLEKNGAVDVHRG